MNIHQYIELYKILKDDNFSTKDALHVIKRVRHLDSEIKERLEQWLSDGESPEITIHGISYNDLVEKASMKKVRAFLMLDWIKSEPTEALYYLAHERNTTSITLSPEEMRQLEEVGEQLKNQGIIVKSPLLPDESLSEEELVAQVLENVDDEETTIE
jgi:hypothetical protein